MRSETRLRAQSLHPPQAALRSRKGFTVAAMRFPATSCPPIAPPCSPLGQPVPWPWRASQPGPCLESPSLLLPLAALRRFPRIDHLRAKSHPVGGCAPKRACGRSRFIRHRRRFGHKKVSPLRQCDSRPLRVRQSRRFLELTSLHPPQAALRSQKGFTVAAVRFPATSCPPIAPLPRIDLASSATGGASVNSTILLYSSCVRRHRRDALPPPAGAGKAPLQTH